MCARLYESHEQWGGIMGHEFWNIPSRDTMGGVRDVPVRLAAITFLCANPAIEWQEKGPPTAQEEEGVAEFLQRAMTKLAKPDLTVHGATQILRHWAVLLKSKTAEELVQGLYNGRATLEQAR